MSTLVIYEELPESQRIFLLPDDVYEKYRNYLDETHGRYVNLHDTNPGMEFLMFAVAKKIEYVNDGNWKPIGCIFTKYEIEQAQGVPITVPAGNVIQRVILTGFVL